MRKIVQLKSSGNFKHTNTFFNRVIHRDFYRSIEQYAQLGVDALKSVTPVDSGETANSWYYTIHYTKDSIRIEWSNAAHIDRVPIAILLQYGHATRDGGYVKGMDFINPAIRPIFKEIQESVWKEVTSR